MHECVVKLEPNQANGCNSATALCLVRRCKLCYGSHRVWRCRPGLRL